MAAACWKAINRCSPRVVPLLPPTGAAGVGSLKPWPGSVTFTIVMCEASTGLEARPAKRTARTAAAWTTKAAIRIFIVLLLLRVGRGRGMEVHHADRLLERGDAVRRGRALAVWTDDGDAQE